MICGKEKEGIGIRPDWVVNTIRWFNIHTFKYKNPNRPVVCRECFQRYRKQRAGFERKRIAYIIIGVVFTIVLALASKENPFSILAGLGVTAFMYLLSLVSYVPELDIPAKGAAQK